MSTFVFTHRFWVEASAACIQRYVMPWKMMKYHNKNVVYVLELYLHGSLLALTAVDRFDAFLDCTFS